MPACRRSSDAASGAKVAIAESDVEDYPGLWLRGTGGNGLAATFPPYPLEENAGARPRFQGHRSRRLHRRHPRHAHLPWRVLGIAEKDGDLLTNQLVWLLAKPSQVADTSWIKPGKVAWDWWNALNLYGVDFKAGVNTETYKYYIDFAAKYGLQYIILDEGWYKLGNLLEVVPELNMEELTRLRQTEKCRHHFVGGLEDAGRPVRAGARRSFEKWGVKGLKVDFMQRDDQKLINFYHKTSRARRPSATCWSISTADRARH